MKIKISILAIVCLVLAVLPFGGLWPKLLEWLSPSGLQRYGVFHWGVLGLCALWLWLKRQDIWPRMKLSSLNLPSMLAGMLLLALSVLLPRSDNFLVFLMLVGWLGIFIILFSRSWMIPSVLLAIYGFSVAFPIFMIEVIGEPSAITVAKMVAAIGRVFGLPVVSQGVVLQFSSMHGDIITTTMTPGCVGYATIGVFMALFSLMMLDFRLPLRKAWYIFLIGLAGTFLQNIIRMVGSIAAGYYWGSGGLETVHNYLAYVIFPLWYALFAYIYLKQARPESASTNMSE